MSLRDVTRKLVIGATVSGGFDRRAYRQLQTRVRSGHPLVQVVCLHATPKRYAQEFRQQIAWVNEHFRIIDFPTLKQWWRDPHQAATDDRPAVLFTFDDGLLSNYEVGVPLLEEVGARAMFFVVPRFARTTREAAREFFAVNLLDDPSECPADPDFWQPMNRQQILELAERGHTIGNHTLSHSRLRRLAAAEQRREILESANLIEDWIGRHVETFAWTFKWDTIDANAWRCALEHHEYCFAPAPGRWTSRDSPQLIWRMMVEAWYPSKEYRYMYSGLTIPMWRRRRALLQKTFAETQSVRTAN